MRTSVEPECTFTPNQSQLPSLTVLPLTRCNTTHPRSRKRPPISFFALAVAPRRATFQIVHVAVSIFVPRAVPNEFSGFLTPLLFAVLRTVRPMTFTSGHLQSPASDDGLEPLLLTIKQVARLLGVCRATACRLNSDGRLPRPIRFGRAVRWDFSVLKDWIAAGAPPRERWEAMCKSARSTPSKGRAA